MAPRKSFKMTPMARAFFRHYERKQILMKQYLEPEQAQPQQQSNFTTDYSTEFN